jgi:hypothetical protein
MDAFARKLAERIEADLFAVICGLKRWQPQTALQVSGGRIETVQLDDSGRVIEPCCKCGPVLLCSEHMALVA